MLCLHQFLFQSPQFSLVVWPRHAQRVHSTVSCNDCLLVVLGGVAATSIRRAQLMLVPKVTRASN